MPHDDVKPVSVPSSPQLENRLDAAARRQQVSRSLLVCEFVAAGLAELDTPGRMMGGFELGEDGAKEIDEHTPGDLSRRDAVDRLEVPQDRISEHPRWEFVPPVGVWDRRIHRKQLDETGSILGRRVISVIHRPPSLQNPPRLDTAASRHA